MSWFVIKGWRWLGQWARLLALATSYVRIGAGIVARDPQQAMWWDLHRWNGSEGDMILNTVLAILIAWFLMMAGINAANRRRGGVIAGLTVIVLLSVWLGVRLS